MENDNLINVLTWHFECKKLAVDKICSFKPPADLFEIRMYHTMYLQSFISIVDIMNEKFKDTFIHGLQERLITQKFLDGKENYLYVRELRNTAIHRLGDITKCGHVIGGVTCVLTPLTTITIPKKKGESIKEHQAFEEYMRDIFAVCEKSLGGLVYKLLEPIFNSTEENPQNKYVKEIIDAHGMPNWAKIMALSNISSIPFNEIKDHQNKKLIEFLRNDKSSKLSIA